jgi:hypothetical protein
MQIVSCEKRNTGDSVNRGRGDTAQFEDVQVEEWDIVVDVAGASSSWIIANAPLPNFGSAHPDNPNLRCDGEYQIRRVDGSPLHFQATVTYKGLPSGQALPDPQLEDKKPEKRDREPYSEEWDTVESQEQIDTDVNGDSIQTKTGEQFDPPVTKDVHDIQMVFGKNVPSRNSALIRAAGKTNSALFKEFGAGQCLIKSVQYKFFTDPDTDETYWRQTVTIHAREAPQNNVGKLPVLGPDLWKKRIRAEGYMVNVAGRDKPVKAKDDNGDDSPVPVLHDKTTGEQIDDPTNADWYLFQVYESTDYSTLNID